MFPSNSEINYREKKTTTTTKQKYLVFRVFGAILIIYSVGSGR